METRFPVMLTVAFAFSVAVSGQQAIDPLVTVAGAYVSRFVREFANVVVEERYTQDILFGGSLLGRNSSDVAGPQHRELRADLLLVRTSDSLQWLAFRDVFEVDGAPVRDRTERLTKLFQQPASTALEQAARIAQESARFNIGPTERTVNSPVLALLFLQPEVQPRFRFGRASKAREFSDRVSVVDYVETARPTLIRTVRDTDSPASGRFWIDGTTGEVVQSELVLSGDGADIHFTTLFQRDQRLGVAVPVRMTEEYTLPRSRLIGVATYDNFQQFVVKTETTIGTSRPSP